MLVTGELILLFNLSRQWTLVCTLENRPFLLEYSTYRIINRTEFVNVHFHEDCATWQKLCYHVKTIWQLQMVCLAPITCLT